MNEQKYIPLVKSHFEKLGDPLRQDKVTNPSENKSEFTSKDFTSELNHKISVKNVGGLMSIANLGTGVQSGHMKLLITFFPHYKAIIQNASKISLEKRKQICSEHSVVRWDEIEDIQKYKYEVCEPFIEAYAILLTDVSACEIFLNYLLYRESDIVAVVISDTLVELNYRSTQNKSHITVNSVTCTKFQSKSLEITINSIIKFRLRFKTEGGKILSSIKINLEHDKAFLLD